MTSEFEFHAPQFVDFNSGLDDSEADKFFDVEQDTPQKDENKENKSRNSIFEETAVSSHDTGTVKCAQKTNLSVSEITAVFKTPISDEEKPNSNKKRREMVKAVRRLTGIKKEDRASCIEDIANNTFKKNIEDNLTDGLKNISLRTRKRTHFEGIEIKVKEETKEHSMITRNDQKIKTPKIDLRTRSVIKNNPVINLKRKSNFIGESKAPEKYMAMAEHILHFQRDTPPRFHTSKRRSSGVHGSLLKKRQSYKPRRTIALTPKLMTSLRSRLVEAPSQEEREKLELEEMKKHQVKANPLNDKIFRPPKLPIKSEKPKTTLEPFNLTQMLKKPTQVIDKEPYKFTAKPVPTTILKKPVGIVPKKEIPITIPESPAITKPTWAYYKRVKVAALSNENQESTEDLTSFGVPMSKCEVPKRTEVKPFSFEIRDKEMLEKKEKKIKEILEAEKKAREFKANPAPSFAVPKDANLSTLRHSHLDCSKASKSVLNEESQKPFKARSPRVLHKEPFRPVMEHVHSEPLDIQLWTDRRAQDRKEFELKQMEKEEHLAGLKQLIEIRKKEEEEAEIAKLRKDLVHKAQPMPKFKPVPLNEKVTSSQPVTNPQSPRFTKRSRTTTLCSKYK